MLDKTTLFLIDKLKLYIEENNMITSIYQCDCGFGQGHQIVYCPKCGEKMIYLKNISFFDLYRKNKKCIEWSSKLRFDFSDKYPTEIKKIFNSTLLNIDEWHELWNLMYIK